MLQHIIKSYSLLWFNNTLVYVYVHTTGRVPIHPFIDTAYFSLLAAVNNALTVAQQSCINMDIQISAPLLSVLEDIHLKVELLGHMAVLGSAL